MPGLRSQHFRDNKRLQSCLVSDPAHVTQGQSGEHVELIQFALMRLQLGQRALLVDAHQPAVAHNIRSQNSSKATFGAFFGHPDCWLS